jgi:hypothetical protein
MWRSLRAVLRGADVVANGQVEVTVQAELLVEVRTTEVAGGLLVSSMMSPHAVIAHSKPSARDRIARPD